MTVSTTTIKNSYSGNGSTTAFSYTFKVFASSEIKVIVRTDSTGSESVRAEGSGSTNYAVSGVGDTAGGTVTFVTAPASGETVVILRDTALTQATDYQPADPFPAESHEDALDKLTHIVQEVQEEVDRSFKVSRTNSITTTEFTEGSSDRANKLLSFDASGDLSVAQELGIYRGDWAASTSYDVRDLVKDTSTNNIFIATTAHTSSGSQPLTTNTDSAKWSLIVDAASATSSQTAAAASATAAASSATAAASSATAAASSATSASSSSSTASTKASEASTSAASAAASFDDFDDRYLGAKSSEPSADNDGDALVTGALFFDTTAGAMKVYTGSAWEAAFVGGSGFLAASNNLSDVAAAATARTNLGLGTIATQAANSVSISGGSVTGITDLVVADGGTGASSFTANGVIVGNGSSALQVTATGSSGEVLTSNGSGSAPTFQALAASGGTVDLVADGAITAGKPVAITPDGKVKQISSTGYTMTEAIGSTVATSSRNATYAYLVYDESNEEVLSGINISGNSYFARIPLDSSLNTTYTSELTVAHGGSDWLAGIGMVYNPVIDRIWCGGFRLSNEQGYLLRNNSGTLSATASDSFGTASAYGSVDVNRSTGAMYIAGQGSATGGASGMGYADTSISEVVKAHNSTHLGSTSYGQTYSYYGAFRHIPHVGLVYMRLLYDIGVEFQFLTSEQWNKDQLGAYNSSSLTGGTIGRYGTAPTLNSTSTPDRTIQVVADSGTGQHHYPIASQWHPWARRLIMPGRSRAGTGSTISTVSFQNGQAEMSYGVGLTGVPLMSYHGPHFVPIPGTHAFVMVYYDSSDSNKLSYRTIDIKLGRTASEDDFVVGAARQIDTNSNSNCCAVWDQNRQAMVVSAKHTSQQRYYGVKPQLAVSNARNFIGFASSTVSDTQTLTVHLKGAVNENQSSLVTGRRYLVGHDGNLIEADNNVDKSQGMPFVGTSISATKILVGA